VNRIEKNEHIEQIHGRLSQAGSVFLVDMTGLKVPAVTDLRRKIKAASGSCVVVKNRLAARASAGTVAEVLSKRFKGPIGVVTHGSDPIAVAKILTDFSREHPQLQMKGAAVSGRLTEGAEIAKLASLPGFQELRSMLLGVLQAPASKLVRLLSTPGSQLARVLDARREKMES
jgi:large subunit ribosomal protein L10